MLGKRKRQAAEPITKDDDSASDSPSGSEIDAQEIFRRHFEAQFEALPEVEKPVAAVDREEEKTASEEEEEDWNGISDNDEEMRVQVVQHTTSEPLLSGMSREQLKAFMSSKPPSSTPKSALLRAKKDTNPDDDDDSETANLKKDLALQRLLSESHLLESSTNPVLSGANRHRATDLRIQALGSKTSILKQAKMPMSHRKGIVAKQNLREETRRREARENGIILEKAKITKKKGAESRRDRGVGGPGVGKFSGGTLSLSKKDILEIEGPKRHSGGRGSKKSSMTRGKRR